MNCCRCRDLSLQHQGFDLTSFIERDHIVLNEPLSVLPDLSQFIKRNDATIKQSIELCLKIADAFTGCDGANQSFCGQLRRSLGHGDLPGFQAVLFPTLVCTVQPGKGTSIFKGFCFF